MHGACTSVNGRSHQTTLSLPFASGISLISKDNHASDLGAKATLRVFVDRSKWRLEGGLMCGHGPDCLSDGDYYYQKNER